MEKELLCILKKYETHPDFLGDTIKDINQVGAWMIQFYILQLEIIL